VPPRALQGSKTATLVSGAMSQLRGLLSTAAAAVGVADGKPGPSSRAASASTRAAAQLVPAAGDEPPPDADELSDYEEVEPGEEGLLARADTAATCVLPVQPTSIYEHSIAARPNFDLRHKPASSMVFVWVNVGIITAIIVGAALEILAKGWLS